MGGSPRADRTRLGAAFRRLALSPRTGVLGALAKALVCVAIGALIRLALSPAYGDAVTFMPFIPAVLFASLWGGRSAGLAALALSVGAAWGVASVSTPGQPIGLSEQFTTVMFLCVGGFVVVASTALREALRGMEAAAAEIRASRALAGESQRTLEAMVDQASAGIAHVGPDGRVVSANTRFADILGMAHHTVIGLATADVSHPDDVGPTLEALAAARTVGGARQVEKRYVRPDGSVVWALTSMRPLIDEGGADLGWTAVILDITEAKATEAALRESEQRFRLLADTAPSPVWLTNAEAEVEFVNRALIEFYGRPAEEILGHVWKQAIHPDDLAHVAAAQAEARPQLRPYGFEARFQHADGGWRWMRVSVNPRFDGAGEFQGYVGMSFDISDARAAIEALAAQERRQTFLLELSDRLRDLSEPSQIMSTVEAAVGKQLGAARVGYAEVDAERQVVRMTADWTEGVASAEGEFALSDLGAGLIDELARDIAVSVPDVRTDPRTTDAVDTLTRLQVRSLARAPVVRSGRLRAYLYAHDTEVRDWTRDEVDLLEEVAARTWAEIERARAQLSVRESESRFRDIADTAPVLIWVTRQDRVRDFVNQTYVAFLGGDYESVRLADWRSYIHPDDQDRLVAESLAGEATRQPFSLEARYLRHDGEYRWLKSFSRPRLTETGEVIGFVGVAFDVTDIRESNARLAAAAAERDAILSQLAEGVVVTDPEGRIVFVNQAAIRQHGVERLDVSPDDYSATYHLFTEDGAPYPPHELPLARAVTHNETVTDARWRIRRPDGVEVLAIGNARPVIGPDGRKMGAVLTLRDETARIAAEAALSESEARFRTVADSAPALIWMADDAAQITFANRRYKTFFGVDADRFLGDRWRDMVHPDDVDIFAQAFLRAFEQKDLFEAQVRVLHPTMGVRWLRCEGVPRFDAAGGFQGYVGANLDVTDAKKAEDDLKRINELLEERVGEALAEKAKAEADLMHAQRMEAVGRLTGGVAHDFNNLLTVVIGALDMMLRSEDSARSRKLAEAALSAARRGEGLTHQLLAFSRRQALRPTAVDLNALIRESEPLLKRAVGEAVAFKLKLKRGGARVSVDPAQFEAALLNLVVNARDAVGDKGTIKVQTLDCQIEPDEIRELAPGDYVCITVSDNGSGMAPDVMARVFEPFFTTKAVGKGTGLGLSQVYGFARQSGGGVHVSSTLGRGTEIRLFLPPLAEEQAVVVEEAPAAVGPVTGRRILLVEDDHSVAAVALELLEDMGLEVRAVENGPDALAVLKKETFDLMLTDIVMPGGMTGVELARHAARRWPDMRIVLTSGYAGEDVDEALADAPWPLVRKPYSTETLRQQLGESLQLTARD